MSDTDLPPMTVVGLTIDAFQRLHAARVEPHPTGLVPVRGRNAQGKSSLIEAMLAGLLGAREGSSPLPIHDGQHGARVELDLGEILVERKWTHDSGGATKTKLVVRARDGSEIRSPQAVLNALTGEFADPVKFLGMKAEEQVRTVLQVLGLGDQLTELEAALERVMSKRRDASRDAERLTKAVGELAKEVDGLPPAPAGEKGPDALGAEMRLAMEHNARVDDAEGHVANAANAGRQASDDVERLKRELADAERRLEGAKADYTRAHEQRHALGDRIDVAPIESALAAVTQAGEHAATRRVLKDKREELEQAQQALAVEEEQVATKRSEIAELLGSVEFPIDGMHYDAEAKALTINGIPFAGASQAEKLAASAAIAMAGEPRIRVMFAREGSLLDHDSLELLSGMAVARGFQLWIELVDDQADGVGIYIEDGEVAFAEEVDPVERATNRTSTTAADDARKFLGLAPYNTSANIVKGDEYFESACTQRHGAEAWSAALQEARGGA